MTINYGKDETKFFVSTKAALLEKSVNEWMDEARKEYRDFYVVESIPTMSFTNINGKGAYMIGCMIRFTHTVEVTNEDGINLSDLSDTPGFGLSFDK